MVRLKKSMGQHLILSEGVTRKIVEEMDINEGDLVIEMGGGTGNLTSQLLKTPLEELTVVEIDPEMVKTLEKIEDKRLKVIKGDATRINICDLYPRAKITGNLPYNVWSRILINVIYNYECLPLGVFMLQKEVAERLSSTKSTSWLGTFINTYYNIIYIMSVPARFFTPKPRVDSGVIKMVKRYENVPKDKHDYKKFLIRVFKHKRKMLKKKLPERVLELAGIDPASRVDQLNHVKIIRLYNLFKETQ